jgi:4-oxalomesaconate tautomerase
MLMRGGTSKGAFFLAEDLPSDPSERDDLLLRIMGSPDPRQIDGVGGAHPLTSKVAVVSPSNHPDADLDYLFLQVVVDQSVVSDRQNCGNMLAGVGPFAVERGLIPAADGEVSTRIRMVNSDGKAISTFRVRDGLPVYEGAAEISGVPGGASPITLTFLDTIGSSTGSLLPTGNFVDVVDGTEVTLIDNGMPVVVMRAADVGITGSESCADLEADSELRARLETIRLAAGPLMNLGDVSDLTIPKLTMVAPPKEGGSVATRTFIPHRCHASIGIFGAVTVATACFLPGTPAADVAELTEGATLVRIEHPTGSIDATVMVGHSNGALSIGRSGIINTARKLMDGVVFPR